MHAPHPQRPRVDPTAQERADAVIDELLGRYDFPVADLDALVQMTALVCGVPMAEINVMTTAERIQVATYGITPSPVPRAVSMCTEIMDETEPVVVPDTTLDPRFADKPFVNGEIRDVRFYAARTLVTQAGTPIGSICVFDDHPRDLADGQVDSLSTLADRVVTLLELSLQTRALEESVAEAELLRRDLERANGLLAGFAGQVSRDLRGPLEGIEEAIEELSARFADPVAAGSPGLVEVADLADELLGTAARGTVRMHALIDGLLDFARVGGELQPGAVDLAAVVAAVREDLAAVLVDAHVEVEPLPVVDGDALQLRAVLQNLLANAAKFHDPAVPADIRVTARRHDDVWCVRVQDRGTGVDAADAERAFRPLTRLDTTVEGSGIGLATCRRIIEAHGGRTGLTPREGGGTTAWFELPA